MTISQIKIIDVTEGGKYKKYLYRCLAGPPSRGNKKRLSYLGKAIPKGFHKKLLIVNGKVIGTIEYAPSEVSYYPIIGNQVIVMNCIWVLRKAKGHNFGRLLTKDMVKCEKAASGFATIALKNHWSPWFRKWQMEKLGFKSVKSMDVKHKLKYKGKVFSIHLMWMKKSSEGKAPTWNRQKLLEGITSCIAHPLYHPQTYELKNIFEKE